MTKVVRLVGQILLSLTKLVPDQIVWKFRLKQFNSIQVLWPNFMLAALPEPNNILISPLAPFLVKSACFFFK